MLQSECENEIFSGSLQAEMIQETKSGLIVEDAAELVTILETLYSEFSLSNEIKCNYANTEQHSSKNYVKVLADVLHQKK